MSVLHDKGRRGRRLISRAARVVAELSDHRASRRSAIAALVILIERLLAPLLVYVAVGRGRGSAVLVAGAMTLLFAARTALQARFETHTETRLYQRIVDAMLGRDFLVPNVVPQEEARAAVFEGMHRAARTVIDTIPSLAANGIAAVVLTTAVVLMEPARVLWAGAAALALGVGALFALRTMTARVQDTAWRTWLAVADGVTDAMDGGLELVSAGREEEYKKRFADLAENWFAQARRANTIAGAYGRAPVILLMAGTGLAVLIDATMRGSPWGQTVEHALFLVSITPPFVGLAQAVPEWVRSAPRLHLLHDLLRAPRRVEGLAVAEQSPAVIEWSSVSFEYVHSEEDSRLALSDVSFSWRRGETLALVGPNGSGKSTCIRALLGLVLPQKGGVLLDGKPLSLVNKAQWRRGIAFLSQRPYLPNRMTIRECLQFLEPLEEGRMKAVLDSVGLWNTLAAVSSDPLSVALASLSVGQRHRVALARALSRTAPLLVLDEPEATLDRSGLELLASVVRQESGNRSILLSTHAEELVACADRVVRLESGRLVQAALPLSQAPSFGEAKSPG